MYGVKFVRDEELPQHHAWVMTRDDEGRTRLFVKESQVTAEVLEQAWAGYRKLAEMPTVPHQRRGGDPPGYSAIALPSRAVTAAL